MAGLVALWVSYNPYLPCLNLIWPLQTEEPEERPSEALLRVLHDHVFRRLYTLWSQRLRDAGLQRARGVGHQLRRLMYHTTRVWIANVQPQLCCSE